MDNGSGCQDTHVSCGNRLDGGLRIVVYLQYAAARRRWNLYTLKTAS